MSLGTIFLVVALVCFLLAAFNVAVKKVSLLGLGLAFFTLAMLLTQTGLRLR
jgi:O-antigen ligase